MLESAEQSRVLTDAEYKEKKNQYQLELNLLQKHLKGEKIPLVIVVEGPEASGASDHTEKLLESLDPRGFRVFSFEEDLADTYMPFLQPYWQNIPPKGKIHLFERSWYHKAIRDRVSKKEKKHEFYKRLEYIKTFEKTLTNDGTHIVKFWIHVSQKQQKQNLQLRKRNPETAWRLTSYSAYENRHYERMYTAAEEAIQKTGEVYAPWHIISARNPKASRLDIMRHLLDTFERIIGDAFRKKALEAILESQKQSILSM